MSSEKEMSALSGQRLSCSTCFDALWFCYCTLLLLHSLFAPFTFIDTHTQMYRLCHDLISLKAMIFIWVYVHIHIFDSLHPLWCCSNQEFGEALCVVNCCYVFLSLSNDGIPVGDFNLIGESQKISDYQSPFPIIVTILKLTSLNGCVIFVFRLLSFKTISPMLRGCKFMLCFQFLAIFQSLHVQFCCKT